jgi:hypothetical protein
MLGLVRTKAASRSLALLLGLGLGVTFSPSGAEAQPSSSKTAKKQAKPAQAAPLEDDSSDIEITVIDPGTTKKKPPPPTPKKGKKGKKTQEVVPEEVVLEEEPEKPKAPAPAPSRYHKNWGTFAIQQDFLSYSSEGNVCPSTTATGEFVPGAEQYSCRDAAGVYPGEVVNGAGNTVSGGIGVATTRILLGYERVFIDRLAVGGRIGWAFRTAPSAEGDGKSLPLHIEARAAYYFGQAPFERRSIRPFASLGAGIGEVDGVVKVDVYAAPGTPPMQLDAWRKTGTVFAALGGGAAYPIGDFAINAELRAILLMGAPAFALGLGIGAAYGF